jgi:hypothetical protein
MSFYNTLITPYEVIHEMKDVQGTSDDALMLKFVNDVSAQIARYADRHFVPRIQTRYFDAIENVRGYTLMFDADLLAATTITNGDATTVSASSYVTEPRNDTPYYGLKLKASAGLSWTWQTDHENALSVLGVWGYHNEYADAWVQVTTLAATVDSTSATSMTLTDADAVRAGQLIKIDSEFINVGADNGTTISGLGRGANGSTAAVHSIAAAVYAWQPVYEVRELAREGAAALYRLRANPLAESYVAQDGTQFVTPKDVGIWLRKRVVELGVKRN